MSNTQHYIKCKIGQITSPNLLGDIMPSISTIIQKISKTASNYLKNHYLPPPYPHFNVAQPCNHVYQMWGLSGNPKQHFPTLKEGERGSLRYFLDDCLKFKKFEKDTLFK